VRIWELTDRAGGGVHVPRHLLKGHPDRIAALSFSPDGQRFVSVGTEGSLKVWDVATGQELSSAKLAKDKFGGAAFSPDGQLLAYGGEDGTVRVWSLSSGQEVRVLTVDDRQRRGRNMLTINAITFSPDGRRLAAAGMGLIRLWDTLTFQEVYTISPAGAGGNLAFSPDSGFLIGVGNMAMAQEGSTPTSSATSVTPLGVRDTAVLWDGRPLTPEREAEREALALLDHLFNRPLPRKDVLEHLRTDPVLREPVRQAALRLIAHYREEDDPKRFADAARTIARSAYLPAGYYAQALSQAETACALAPADGYCLTALGMVQYRLGKYREALKTLTRAEPINARTFGVGDGQSLPVDLGLMVLVHHRLGNEYEVCERSARLYQRMQDMRWRYREETDVLLREIELLLDGTPPIWPGTGPGAIPVAK
jgi:hypothetical protein